MNRTTCLAYLGSLVCLAAAGCVAPDYPPLEDPTTDPVLATEDGQPRRDVVQTPPRADLIEQWQLPTTSPWLPYEKFTLPSVLAESPEPVSLPEVTDLDDVRLAHLAGARVAEEGLPSDAAWFIDLPGAASVSFAYALSHLSRASIAAIPTFNNWPAENELVPAEQTLAAMITMPPRLPDVDDIAARPVFLLDSWRLAYKEELIPDDVIDNRYMLTPADFPTAAVLRSRGITQIVYVVESADIQYEEDDLHDLFADYEAAGIVIYMVDLESLARANDEWDVPWFVEIRSHCFIVRPRATCVHDPRFYRRAHGGFGGAHLLPVPGGHVHSLPFMGGGG